MRCSPGDRRGTEQYGRGAAPHAAHQTRQSSTHRTSRFSSSAVHKRAQKRTPNHITDSVNAYDTVEDHPTTYVGHLKIAARAPWRPIAHYLAGGGSHSDFRMLVPSVRLPAPELWRA